LFSSQSRNELLPPLTSPTRLRLPAAQSPPPHVSPAASITIIVQHQGRRGGATLSHRTHTFHPPPLPPPPLLPPPPHPRPRRPTLRQHPWALPSTAIHCPRRRLTPSHVSLRPSARLSPPCPHSIHCRRKSCASVRVSVTASELSLGDHRDRRHPCPSLTLSWPCHALVSPVHANMPTVSGSHRVTHKIARRPLPSAYLSLH
jgi:hypothetical protein